jgi:hypothetical protein
MTTKKTKLSITQIKAIVENYKQAWDVKINERFDASDEHAKKAAEVEIATLAHRATMYETDPALKDFIAGAVKSRFNSVSDKDMYEQGIVSKTYYDASVARNSIDRSTVRDKMCADLKLALMLDPSADYTQVAATIETLNFNWKDMKDGTS